jgi:hypothetical protein
VAPSVDAGPCTLSTSGPSPEWHCGTRVLDPCVSDTVRSGTNCESIEAWGCIVCEDGTAHEFDCLPTPVPGTYTGAQHWAETATYACSQ